MRRKRGFTAIELMVVVAVLGILLVWAVPAFDRLREKMRLVRATQPVYDQLVYAHSEAIKRFRPFVVSFAVGDPPEDGSGDPAPWWFGMTDADGADSCDPEVTDATAEDACAVDLDNNAATDPVLMRTLSTEYPEVAMRGQPENGNAIVCTDGGANVRFDVPTGVARSVDVDDGLVNENCAIVLSTARYETRVRVGPTGLVWICSPEGATKVSWYPRDC